MKFPTPLAYILLKYPVLSSYPLLSQPYLSDSANDSLTVSCAPLTEVFFEIWNSAGPLNESPGPEMKARVKSDKTPFIKPT